MPDTANKDWGYRSRTLTRKYQGDLTPQVLEGRAVALDGKPGRGEVIYCKLPNWWLSYIKAINGNDAKRLDFITRNNTCFFNAEPRNGDSGWWHGRESVFTGSWPGTVTSLVAGKIVPGGYVEILTFKPEDRPDILNVNPRTHPWLFDWLTNVGHDKITLQTEWAWSNPGEMICPRIIPAGKKVYLAPHQVRAYG